jgi:transcriptional regulator with XRE-family HTH domain
MNRSKNTETVYGKNCSELLIKALRERNCSQKELADLIGINPGTLSRIIRGESYPLKRTWKRIVDALDLKDVEDRELSNKQETPSKIIFREIFSIDPGKKIEVEVTNEDGQLSWNLIPFTHFDLLNFDSIMAMIIAQMKNHPLGQQYLRGESVKNAIQKIMNLLKSGTNLEVSNMELNQIHYWEELLNRVGAHN